MIATTFSELSILSRVVDPNVPNLSPSAAKALQFGFAESDRNRMRELLAKNKSESLTELERQEMDGYERVGYFLDLLHSKARLSIKNAAN